MTKKKDRRKSDVAGDPTTNFFQQIVKDCYLNAEYVVTPPQEQYYSEFPEDEKCNWDPNNLSIFEHERDGNWLRATWEDYVRPKYKKALDKWNKDTGGGDGSPTAFIDFCGTDRWLVWLFCKDMECNFLLACSAGGRMPRHLQVESGFTEEMSSLGDDTTNNTTNKIETQVTAIAADRKRIASALEEAVSCLKNKQEDPTDSSIRQVTELSKMMQDESALESVSPETKEVCVSTIKRQRKGLINKMNERNNDQD